MNNVYVGLTKQKYQLGNKISAGGEGIVYDVVNQDDIVIKLYHPNLNVDFKKKERKLKTMINMHVPYKINGNIRFTWPIDILYDGNKMVGFTMPKMKKTLKIFSLQRFYYDDISVKQNNKVLQVFPKFNWINQLQVSYSLAQIVTYLHQYDIVIGDFNVNNVFLDIDSKQVVIIDCDSFDIYNKQTKEHFSCEVCLPEILAPELQAQTHVGQKPFTKESDNFSLGIHIFRLLMRNANPFGGVATNNASYNGQIAADMNIVNGNCPYVRKCELKIPNYAPDLSILPVSLQNAFKRTFTYDQTTIAKHIKDRTTAREWCDLLYPLCNPRNPHLQHCKDNSHHVYLDNNAKCPWCELKKKEQRAMIAQKVMPVNYPLPIHKKTGQQKTKANHKYANPTFQRSPYPFYYTLIGAGILNGFCFANLSSNFIYQRFGLIVPSFLCGILLMVAGVLLGYKLAQHFERKYVQATHYGWLALAIVSFFLPMFCLELLDGAFVLIKYIVIGLVITFIIGALISH